ncbi:cx9C motif-containing protein 4 isoform X2 [Salmo salar]|uniref:Cx9C motif-containing protein 4 isoform X2 n=1 Tax=Salmo salar TaxID=8030 RepID=A0A1S3L0G7_SALSA|nr:cx9C motif-containing protein 4 isoform X2 [Salmo salar]|eukprot:XP_013984408.1 PREDICTED: cx9C motif-containing protein 4 isoform X2 [Salmo salar]
MPQKDPCQKQACAIQKCLQANKYIESRCEDVIRAMRMCCEHAGENSICCSGFSRERKSTEPKIPGSDGDRGLSRVWQPGKTSL